MFIHTTKVSSNRNCFPLIFNGPHFLSSFHLELAVSEIATNELYWCPAAPFDQVRGYLFKDYDEKVHVYMPTEAYWKHLESYELSLHEMMAQGIPLVECFNILCL